MYRRHGGDVLPRAHEQPALRLGPIRSRSDSGAAKASMNQGGTLARASVSRSLISKHVRFEAPPANPVK